jgi:alpha-L-rhamnosidase
VLRTSPFVWLPSQRFDHSLGFASLRGGALRREDEAKNRWILARGHFTAPAGETELCVTVDGQYRAWLAGAPLGRGPVRSTPHFHRFDRYRQRWRGGDGLLALLVHVPGVDLAWYETVKGAWQPIFGDGGIWAELRHNGELTAIDWRLAESDAWRSDVARSGWGQDFVEDFDGGKLDPRWIENDFNDDCWHAARPMISLGDRDQTARGFGYAEPFPSLIASELPPPREIAHSPERLVYVRTVVRRADLPIERQIYEEIWEDDASGMIDALPSSCGQSNDWFLVRTGGNHDTGMMFAFEPYHTGFPFLEIEGAVGGEIVDIAVGEALPGEFGRGIAGDGLRLEGHLAVAHVFRYAARAGSQRFEKFSSTAIRAMQVVVRNAPNGMRLRVGTIGSNYAAEPVGAFECSDQQFNDLWRIARHTVQQCMQDAWIDCPGRESRQWVGDAVVQFDVAARTFGPSVYPLHRQFLVQAVEGQRADGLLRMFAPGDVSADALVIPDSSLLWIIGAERYFRESGDGETIERIMTGIERALGWFERHANAEGLLQNVPHWHFIEWANIGRDGISAPINALFAGALKAGADLADAVERPRLASRWRRSATLVAEALNQSHWDEARRVYVDNVDPKSRMQGRRVSQHSNALMLLFALAPAKRAAQLVETITDVTRLKLTAAPPIVPEGDPFDENVDVVRANSFLSHFVYDGLVLGGCFEWVLDDVRRVYAPMLATGTSTLWESFSPTASLCHGFSASPAYQMSRWVLGIEAVEPGYSKFKLNPRPADLAWARGTIATPAGPITVAWEARGDGLDLMLEYPPTLIPSIESVEWRVVADRATGNNMRRYRLVRP